MKTERHKSLVYLISPTTTNQDQLAAVAGRPTCDGGSSAVNTGCPGACLNRYIQERDVVRPPRGEKSLTATITSRQRQNPCNLAESRCSRRPPPEPSPSPDAITSWSGMATHMLQSHPSALLPAVPPPSRMPAFANHVPREWHGQCSP